MKIVILDGHTLNPGDLSWEPLESLGNLTVYERTAPELVVERAEDAEIVLTNKTKVQAASIAALPKLKYIGELATGYDNVDVKAAAQRNIPVCNVPGYSTHSVAQLTWALILQLTYSIGQRSADVHDGGWTKSDDFCYGHQGLFELHGKTLGLIGLGQIGTAVAQIALAFGMKVKAVVRHPEKYDLPAVQFVDLDECFTSSDFISLHCPLTDETRGMVNEAMISKMKRTACLINTARGPLIQENDLALSLKEQQIAGAALDVLSVEPPKQGSPLFGLPNCIITPHIAWATREARERLLNESVKNIQAFLSGDARNVVNF